MTSVLMLYFASSFSLGVAVILAVNDVVGEQPRLKSAIRGNSSMPSMTVLIWHYRATGSPPIALILAPSFASRFPVISFDGIGRTQSTQ